jgi:multidrug resistance efflux pump
VDLTRTKDLQAKQLLPVKSVDDKERELLQLRRSLAVNDADRTQTQIRIAQLDRTLEQLGITEQRDSAQTSFGLIAAYQKLRGSVDEWDKRYALRAPQAGRISFAKSASERRFVNQNEEVATLVPDGSHAIVGRLSLPEQNSGLVKIGQMVYIRLDGFPFQEYGTVEGRVKQIALVPRDGRYAIDVELPQQLTTTFRRKVELRQEMQGDADVVTENLRVIERLFHQFRRVSAR